jgi:hypothetical protein
MRRSARVQGLIDSFFDLLVLPALLVSGLVAVFRPKKW